MLNFAVVLALCVASSGVQGDAEARTRFARINDELHKPDLPAWAGNYTGEAMLAPNAGFLFTYLSCVGPVYDYGTISSDGDRLCLRSDYSPGTPVYLRIVPWGDRRYLIAEQSMKEFCALVNDGTEPRAFSEGWPMMRIFDAEQAATGLPRLPPEWRSLIPPRVIERRILRVETKSVLPRTRYGRETETRVLLHVGARDGVSLGMCFNVGRFGGQPLRAYVDQVDASSCIALVDTGLESAITKIRVGAVATTGPLP